MLFRSTGRALVTFPEGSQTAVAASAQQLGVPLQTIGRVVGDRLRISVGGRRVIDENVADLADLWTNSFGRAIEAADVL